MRLERRREGFTLVELLTVIGIIAVLSAILFPVLAQGRAKARQARCLSNMQQLGAAIEVYTQDHGGFLPTWSISHPRVPPPSEDAATAAGWKLDEGQPNEPSPGIVTWDISIMTYLKNEDVLVCPDNPNSNAREARSYAIAQYTQKPYQLEPGKWSAYGGDKVSILRPSETVLLFEKGNNAPGSWGDALGQNVYQYHGADAPGDDPSVDDEDEYIEPENFLMWHSGGKNFLYVDYHAKWAKNTSGPFAHKPAADDIVGTCEDWGKPEDGGDWPS